MASFWKGVTAVLLFAPLSHFLSLRTLIVTSLSALFLRYLIYRRSQSKWRIHHGGFVSPGFEKVAEVFKENLRTRQERGASFAVYYKGKLVVDLWGGYADFRALRFRKEDSTSMAYSVTKAVGAICLAYLHDRGLLDYDSPVVKYWPEFGQNNKEDITVKTLLCHRAGLIAIREKHKLSLLRDDPEELGRLLAKQKAFWKPGTAQGYHALTFGLYADQLVRRIDPKGRSLGKFFHDEIASKFDIDFVIGQPKEQFHRACRETRINFGWKYFFTTTIPVGIKFTSAAINSLIRYKRFYLRALVGNPTDFKPRRMNDPDFRDIECCASHGFGTSRGLAKLMGILANGGKMGDEMLLTPETIEQLGTPLSSDHDRVILRNIAYGPGTMILDENCDGQKLHHAFGHWGAGGQMAFSDPENKIGWAYLTNYGNMLHGFIVDHRYAALEKAMYKCLNEIHKNE